MTGDEPFQEFENENDALCNKDYHNADATTTENQAMFVHVENDNLHAHICPCYNTLNKNPCAIHPQCEQNSNAPFSYNECDTRTSLSCKKPQRR